MEGEDSRICSSLPTLRSSTVLPKPWPQKTRQSGDPLLIKKSQETKKTNSVFLGPYEFIKYSEDYERMTAVLKTKMGRKWFESIYNISPMTL